MKVNKIVYQQSCCCLFAWIFLFISLGKNKVNGRITLILWFTLPNPTQQHHNTIYSFDSTLSIYDGDTLENSLRTLRRKMYHRFGHIAKPNMRQHTSETCFACSNKHKKTLPAGPFLWTNIQQSIIWSLHIGISHKRN